jgi:hypothetical protein
MYTDWRNSLERIKDASIIRMIEQISVHYQTNIASRFIRPLFLQLQIDKNTWDLIELLTVKMEMYRYQGFDLDDLYKQIIACARLVEAARSQLVPSIRSRLSSNSGVSTQDKILRDMAANNFSSNLQVFADLLNQLYVNLVEIDKASAKVKDKLPVYVQIPEMANVGRMLVGF